MKKLFSLNFLFFVFCLSSNAQSISKPVYIGGFSPYYEDPDGLYHDIEAAGDRFRTDQNGFFVVRVCSTTPLPIAVTNAAGVNWGIKIVKNQIAVNKYSSNITIPESRIYLLRNTKGCNFYKNLPLTEYWFVPSDAEFPEFAEIRKPEDISSKNLIELYSFIDGRLLSPEKFNDSISLTPEYYEIFKTRLLEMLRKEKSALLSIEYLTTYGKAKNQILNEANKLKTFLIFNGIGKHRIFIKECIVGCGYDNKSNNSKYPNVTIVYQK